MNLGQINLQIIFYFQCFQWLLITSCIYLYALHRTSCVYTAELAFMVIHVICRCLICAVKYGYLSRHFHALMMHTKLSQTLLAQMYVLAAQANYNVFNMNIEVSAVKHRQKVEEETFYFRVPQGGVKERLRGPAFYQSEQAFDIKLIDKEIKDFKDNFQWRANLIYEKNPVIKDFIIDKIISKPLSDQYKLSCESLISEIQYIVRKSNPYSFAFVSLVALVHGFIPVFCRLYQGIRPFGCNSYDYAFFTLCFIQTFLLYTINYMFLVLSHTVYKQQCDIMEIMSSFLTTHNQSANKFNGLFPMINIYCPSTIFSWLKLRGCLLDFGRRYTIRIQMYILILIPFGTALYALLCIKSIANIDLSIPITLEVQSYVIFDTLLLFVNIVKILRIGTHVNSYNIKHKELLLELKQDVLQYRLKQKEKEILTKSIEIKPFCNILNSYTTALFIYQCIICYCACNMYLSHSLTHSLRTLNGIQVMSKTIKGSWHLLTQLTRLLKSQTSYMRGNLSDSLDL